MPALITAIVPIRNRSGARLENCLRSLRWQDCDPQQLEILVVDYGSDESHREAIASAAAQNNARVLWVKEYGVWNRSKALNYGIRNSTTEWVFCTDVDMIFSPNFISCMQKRLLQNEKAFVVCRCHDLPESVPMQLWTLQDYPSVRDQAALRDTTGTGACQAAKKSFFDTIHGYDEGYEYWGAEDDDLRIRARRYGMEEISLTPDAMMLHQWHPTMKFDRPWRKRLNKWRYKLTNWRIVKNRKFWGGAPA